uniref:rRNA N-glycosylase n=1 Tax=Oryza glaberrima TaxID=4538 RepID=I1QWY8_ORYGL
MADQQEALAVARRMAEQRVRLHLQRSMGKRQGSMLDICSTTVDGMPVTPPDLKLAIPAGEFGRPEDRQTFHIVELENPQDPTSMYVQLLFRETDLYFVAFRPLAPGVNPDSANGWFHFKQAEPIIPSFLNSHQINYGYGYINATNYQVGTGCLSDIYFCLREFTSANARLQSQQRRRVLMVCGLMLSETQRFMQMQREVIENIHANNGERQDITHLDGLIHDWGVESNRRVAAADHQHQHGGGEAPAAAPGQVVDYGLWVLKYNPHYVLPLIRRQLQQHPQPPFPPLTPRQKKQQLRRRLLQQRLRQLRLLQPHQHLHQQALYL